MKIFITGGSGFVGGHIIEKLSTEHELYAMARTINAMDTVKKFGATPIECSLETVTVSHLKEMDAVIHCAGYAESWGPTATFMKINVDGTKNMLKAAKEAGVRRFINISTDSVVFDAGNQLDLDESAPLFSSSPYAYCESKMLAEKAVTTANSTNMKTISLRPTLIWGPRDTSILPIVSDMSKKGLLVMIDGGNQLISTCHVYNVVHGVKCALSSNIGGEAYFIKDDDDLTIREWYRYLAKMGDFPIPTRSIPSWFAFMVANVCDITWRVLKLKSQPPISPFAVALMSSSMTMKTDKLRKELNWEPVISRSQGIAEMFPENPIV